MRKYLKRYFIASRVTNPNFDTDDLYAFWDIFVEDAKCSMLGSPDYDKLNTDVDIYYEFESDAFYIRSSS